MHGNKTTLIGNIAQDPMIGITEFGDKYARLLIATGEAWRDRQTQELHETTEWYSVVALRQVADTVEKICKKGARIFVQGEIKTHEKSSEYRYTHVMAEKILILAPHGGSLGQNSLI